MINILLKVVLTKCLFSFAHLYFSLIQWLWCHSLDRGHVGVNIQIMVEEILDGLSYLLEMNQAPKGHVSFITLKHTKLSWILYLNLPWNYIKIQYSIFIFIIIIIISVGLIPGSGRSLECSILVWLQFMGLQKSDMI